LRINKISGLVHNVLVNGKINCNSVNWMNVLTEDFDVVKVDCEGCEQYLLDVPNNILRKVPYWVIECHNAKIFMDLASKFSSAGFAIRYRFYRWSGIYGINSWSFKISRRWIGTAENNSSYNNVCGIFFR